MKTLLTLDKNVRNWSQNDVRRTNRIGIYGTILLKKLVKISCNDYEVTKQSLKKNSRSISVYCSSLPLSSL